MRVIDKYKEYIHNYHMKFGFCDEICDIITKKIIVEFKNLRDEYIITSLLEELNPFIVNRDESLVSNYLIHQDVHYENKYDFYKNLNTIKDKISKILYGELVYNEGWVELHAAGIEFMGKNILLVGKTKSGKSSTGFYFIDKHNGAFIGNDTIFIHPEKNWMIGFPEGFGVSKYVGNLLGLDKKTVITPNYDNYWFTNQHMRNLGYMLKPLAVINLIFFPCFINKELPLRIIKIEQTKAEILPIVSTVNIKKSKRQLDYLNSIPCYKIETNGIHNDYIQALELLVKQNSEKLNFCGHSDVLWEK